MKKWMRILPIAAASSLISMGCAGSMPNFGGGKTSVKSEEYSKKKYMPNLPPNPTGLRAAVLVSAFTTGGEARETGNFEIVDSDGHKRTIRWGHEEQNAVGKAMSDQLQSAMSMTGYFLVNVRGATFASQKEENALAEEGWVTKNKVKKGGLESPDLFVKATITEWTPNAGGGGGLAGGITSRVLGGVGWKNSKSRVGLQLQIVNRKQQIVATIPPVIVEGKSTEWSLGALGATTGMVAGGILNQYSNTSMEQAIAVAIKTSVERIVKYIPRKYFSHEL